MPGHHSRNRSAVLIGLVAIAILSSAALTGCSWLGKGKEVADAYERTREAKSGAYFASLEITAPKRGKQSRIEEYYAASGAFDSTDADHPKSRGEVSINGDNTVYVEPGNGRIYITEDRKTEYIKVAKDDRPEAQENGEGFLEAIARSVVNFHDARPITSRVGQPVPAIGADVSRTKLCGESLRAVARTINNSDLNDDDVDFRVTNSDVKAGTRWCTKQLPTTPTLTFGIENGLLTDFLLDGSVRFGKRNVSIRAKLQFLGLNQPQTGFTPPKVSKKSKGELITLSASAEDAGNRLEELIDSLPAR